MRNRFKQFKRELFLLTDYKTSRMSAVCWVSRNCKREWELLYKGWEGGGGRWKAGIQRMSSQTESEKRSQSSECQRELEKWEKNFFLLIQSLVFVAGRRELFSLGFLSFPHQKSLVFNSSSNESCKSITIYPNQGWLWTWIPIMTWHASYF